MAVALATLPLKSLLVDDGDGLLAAAIGSGRAAGFAGALRTGATGLAVFLVATLAIGFFTAPALGADLGADLGAALGTVLGAAFLTAALLGAGFFATSFPTAVFLGGTFLGGAFLGGVFLPGACLLAACLLDAFLVSAFLTAAFFAGAAFFVGAAFLAGALAGALLAARFGAAFFTAARATGFAEDLADDLLALFTIRSLPAAAFDLTAAALADVLPLCALVAVELALVFAISLHPGWP